MKLSFTLTDLGHQALGLQHVVFPAAGEILEFNDAADNLTPCSKGRVSSFVQPHEHRARQIELGVTIPAFLNICFKIGRVP